MTSSSIKKLVPDEHHAIHAEVHRTMAGTPYLTEAGVILLSQPKVNLEGMRTFLKDFNVDFDGYLDDDVIPDPEQLVKAAGQTCYMSFGEDRTRNSDASKYIENLKKQGHGSVLQHVGFTFLIYGGDRGYSHEKVRHGTGTAFSQESQRYVDGKVLRFCERIEYQSDPELHSMFETRINRAATEYDLIADKLRLKMIDDADFAALSKRDQRKAVNQAARSSLPNETEAIIVATANARAWRHIIEMRASKHADLPIRRIAFRILLILRKVAPLIFSDYRLDFLNETAETDYRKV